MEILNKKFILKWYGSRDLNSHILRYRNLNPARLPIPPNPHFEVLLRINHAEVNSYLCRYRIMMISKMIYSNYMAGIRGFEPLNDGIKTRCLTAWLYPYRGCNNIDSILLERKSNKMAGIRGFEPLNDGIKTRCLTAWLYPCNVLLFTVDNKLSF